MPSAVRVALASIALALPACLAACDGWPPSGVDGGTSSTSGSTPPPTTATSVAVIDSLDVSTNAQAVNGYYSIYGSISFHDDEEPVHAIRVRVPVIGKTYDYPTGDVASIAGAPFTIVVSSDVPLGGAGNTNFEISVVDTKGGETIPIVKTVDLQ